MKKILLVISLILNCLAQDTPNGTEFIELYEWTQSPDFRNFVNETVSATEGQVVLRFDDRLFTSGKSFRDFFEGIARQYKVRLDRLKGEKSELGLVRPEDFSLSLSVVTRMVHLWNHVFKDLADNQMKMCEKINKIDNPNIRSQSLRGWSDSIDAMVLYYSKWIVRLSQFYFAEKSWLMMVRESDKLSDNAKGLIGDELFCKEFYASIDQFAPTLKGLKLALNAAASIRKSSSTPFSEVRRQQRQRRQSDEG